MRPDGVRSSGPSLITRYTYDPVFNQLRTTTDPRAWPNVSGDTPIATDVAHPDEPLLSDNAVGKYTTTRWFDYQDGPRADIQHDLDTWWLNGAVNQSSITFGSGTTNQRAGTVVKETHQLWTDPDHPGGSSLIDTLETHYAVNTRGQPLFTRTLMVPDGSQYRETRFDYWTDSQMGLLYHKVVDLDSDGTAPGIQTTYTYDNWGNLETETDGRLKVTTYSVNALNQIYRVVRNSAGAVGQQYAEETVYDANNNVQFKRVQKQPQAQSGDPRVFIDVESTYDLLDRKTAEVVTVDGRQRATHYVYDKEGRLIRKILPVGNVIGYTYDKVGRQTDVRRYARRSPDGTSAPSADNTNDALTSVRYDGRGNPVSERVTYNANGSGLSTTFLYDGYDRKIETRRHTRTDWSFPVDTNGDGTPAGTEDNYLSEKLTYDVAGLVTAVEQLGDADGQIETNELLAKTETVYDEMGRAILSYQLLDNGSFLPTTHLTHTTSDPVTKTFYTRAGQAARVILPRDATRSNETQFIYDMAGRKKQVTDAFGNVVKYTYDAEDHVTEVRSIEKDSDDVTLRTYVTTSAYDQLGRLIGNSVDPGGTGTLHLTTIYTHDLRGNVTATTDPAGHRTEKDYNEANQVLRSRLCRVGVPTAAPCTGSGQFEETVQYTYDVNGLLAVQTDGLGNETKFLYDELDRKAYTRYPDDTGVAWVYDRAGRTVGIRRQAQVLGVSGAYNMDQHFEPRGSGSTIADPGYDCTGTPACLAETDTYDTRSRLRQRDFSWHNTSSLEYGGTTRQTFAYDGLSRLLASTDNNELASTADDAVIQRSYDTLSRLRAETQTLGSAQLRTVSSAYDLGGARTALTYASTSGGGQPAFTIDTLGRTTAITDGTPIATQLFSGPGLLESRTYGNGMVLNMKAAEGRGYDLAKRIVRVKLEMPNSQTPAAMHFEYGYDADSLRTYERRLHESAVGSSYPGQVFTHVYDHDGDGTATDAAHRLETFSEGYLASTGALATMTQKDSRGYDVEGNWMSITQTVSGSAPTTTSNNRRDAGQGAGMNQYLDFKGNSWLYTFTGALKDDGVQLYRYDGLDRLIEVKHKSPLAVLGTYAYDADNRRVLKTDSSGSTQFVYDGWRGIEDYPVGQALPTARYFWANGVERLLAIQRYEANAWKRRYVHGDALGSVRAVTDTPTGTNAPQVEARFLFGSFGEAIVAGTSGVLSGCGTVYCAVPFRYTGQRFDPESGLYYYKNRYYSPAAGRFLTRDPAGYVDGPNLYAYVRNSATNDGDPLGLFEGGPSTVFGRYCAMGWDNEAGHALNAMEDQMDNFDYDNWEDHHSAEQETNPASQIIGGEGGVSGGPMIMITAPVYSSPSKSKPSPAESAAPSRLKVHVYVDFKDKDIGKNQQKDIMRDAQNRFDEARDNGLDFDVQVENVTGKAVPALGNMDSYIEVGGSRPADSTSLDESGHMWHGTGQGNVWSTTISTKVADRIPAGATRMDAFHTILADNIAHEAGHRLAPANLSPDEPWHDRAGGIMGRKYEWERSVGRIPSTQYNLTPRQFLGTTIGVFNTYAKNPSP